MVAQPIRQRRASLVCDRTRTPGGQRCARPPMIERRADDKLARTEKQNCSVGLERDVLPKTLLNQPRLDCLGQISYEGLRNPGCLVQIGTRVLRARYEDDVAGAPDGPGDWHAPGLLDPS